MVQNNKDDKPLENKPNIPATLITVAALTGKDLVENKKAELIKQEKMVEECSKATNEANHILQEDKEAFTVDISRRNVATILTGVNCGSKPDDNDTMANLDLKIQISEKKYDEFDVANKTQTRILSELSALEKKLKENSNDKEENSSDKEEKSSDKEENSCDQEDSHSSKAWKATGDKLDGRWNTHGIDDKTMQAFREEREAFHRAGFDSEEEKSSDNEENPSEDDPSEGE